MRFLELHLDRFGCFTGRRVTFRADAPLTVIYGPNEAGKSTALAAIADVLYGVEEQSQFKFLHPYSDMRIGATIVGAEGHRLSFRRRKGRQNTLLDLNEKPIGEDALAAFLGNVDRALFLDAFGLNRDCLREGARRLIAGGGRVGESLLAAAPGLSSLIALRTSLRSEAEDLFPAGRKIASRPFWQARERYKEARDRVRHETLHAETVEAVRARRDKSAEVVRALQEQQRQLRQELSRLRRLKAALPRLRSIADLEAELGALGPLPDVNGDFTARCRAALETRRLLELELERLDGEIAESRAKLEGLAVDDALLGEAEAVDRLADERATILKAADDRPKREAELDRVRLNLEEVARQLGLPDGAAVLAARPPDAALTRARIVLAQRRRLRDHREERHAALQTILAELEELARRRRALGHVADTALVRRQLDGLAGLAEQISARGDLARSVEARERKLQETVGRLVVPVATADDLASRPVPDLPSVEQAIELFDDLARRQAECLSERQRLEHQSAKLDRRIAAVAADDGVPTAEAVSEVRRTRERLWKSLRPRLLGETLPEQPLQDLVAYEAAVERADELADRRQAEADRIAELRNLESARRDLDAELRATSANLSQIESAIQAAQAGWIELWSCARVPPRSPREMRAWLHMRSDVLALRDELGGETARLVEMDRSIGDAMAALRRLAETVGLESPHGSAAELLASISNAVGDMERRFHDARLIAERRESCEGDRERLHKALLGLADQDAHWRAEWAQAARAIGLRDLALDEEAEAALAAWQAVPALAALLADLEHRLARMQEDQDTFESAAAALCGTVAPDLVELPPVSAVAALRERLAAAREAAARRDSAGSHMAGLQHKHCECRRQLELNEHALAELCHLASIDEWQSLGCCIGTVERGLELSKQLAAERRALLEVADGLAESKLRADSTGHDPDGLSVRLQEMEDEQDALEQRLNEAIAADTRTEAEMARIDALAGAAPAAQHEQNALADLAGIIETWSALAAAERLLSATIEAYRRQHQNPILDRAGDAFSMATDGNFAGLSLDYDETDAHRIVAVRRGGARLPIEALSEGTADQLFLALRVATIEDHARRTRPLPFIADDLFVTFDDTRTKAGLKLLADLGRTTQVIVFTHHQYVVEAARHALCGQADLVDLG